MVFLTVPRKVSFFFFNEFYLAVKETDLIFLIVYLSESI